MRVYLKDELIKKGVHGRDAEEVNTRLIRYIEGNLTDHVFRWDNPANTFADCFKKTFLKLMDKFLSENR